MTEVVTKSSLMALIARGVAREAYHDTVHGWFDVSAMRLRAAELGELVEVPLEIVMPVVMNQRVAEPQRVMELKDESWRDDPGMFILFDFDENGIPNAMMIDGSHRATRRMIEGEQFMKFWFIPIEKALRPPPGFMSTTEVGIDWGDPVVDGKIIRNR